MKNCQIIAWLKGFFQFYISCYIDGKSIIKVSLADIKYYLISILNLKLISFPETTLNNNVFGIFINKIVYFCRRK